MTSLPRPAANPRPPRPPQHQRALAGLRTLCTCLGAIVVGCALAAAHGGAPAAARGIRTPRLDRMAAEGTRLEEIDWSVGQVLQTLRRLRLDDRTLVIFASDMGDALTGRTGRNLRPAAVVDPDAPR